MAAAPNRPACQPSLVPNKADRAKVTRMGIAGATPNPAMRLRAALEAASAHQSAIVHTAGNDMASVPTGGVAEIRYL